MSDTWTAPDGTLWPVTGFWCPKCHAPIAAAAVLALGAHPWCIYNEREEQRDEQAHLARVAS